MEQPQYTHLHTHTHYSLLDGMSKIPALLDRVKELGMTSIAITDHGVMYGAIEFYQEAKKRGIKPIIGVEAYLSNYEMHDKRPGIDDKRWHLILLAKNYKGYQNLVQLTSLAHLEGFYYKPRIDKKILAQYSDNLICLSACLGGELASHTKVGDLQEAERTIYWYKNTFGEGNFYLEVQDHPNEPEQLQHNKALFQLGEKTNTPVVATSDSHYISPDDADAHDILLAIQTGNKLEDEKRLSLKGFDLAIHSPQQMLEKFSEHPEVVHNTQKIADQCDIEIPMDEYQLPHYAVPEGETLGSHLRKKCAEGLTPRYAINIPDNLDYTLPLAPQFKNATERDKKILKRLDYELGVILKMDFPAYMLIVADIVTWAKQNSIVVGPGRGSAAGSLVSYVLYITNLDPLHYNLLFERFLNPDRISMPDIDLDFADTRRDEVLHYVTQKYGKDNVAQIITFGTMAARVAVRDVGRVLNYEYSLCDTTAKMIPPFYSLTKALNEVDELKAQYNTNEKVKNLIDMALRLEGVCRHASTHACGVVITKEPLTQSVPLQHSTNDEGSIVTQYEMHAIEDLGLLKVDFLGLRNLTIIENTIHEIKQSHNITIQLEEIPLEDAKTFQVLQKGDTTGVFQLESGGMRRYLKDLKPNEFEDIVAMVALYRPGPMELIPQYIRRKFGKEEIEYDHPSLKPILQNTYGIGVYQEQMMQIAQQLGKFTLAQADTLRKAIGKKNEALLAQQQKLIMQGMQENGIPLQTARKIWDLFPPFARYGFNRSHAACYALIAYQTAYLKAHYPTEFMVALLNAELKNIERLSFLITEASEHDINVLPPSIQESGVVFTKEDDQKIRFGLSGIKNVGTGIVEKIIETRKQHPFTSLEEFFMHMSGTELNKKSLESLIKAGAFDCFNETRTTLLHNMEAMLNYMRDHKKQSATNLQSLFGGAQVAVAFPTIEKQPEPSTSQRLGWEKELLGFYISGHPLKQHQEALAKSTNIDTLKSASRGNISITALVNSTKRIITKRGDTMLFFGIEDLTGKIEAIAFPSVFMDHQNDIAEGNVLELNGKVNSRNGEKTFICEKIKILQKMEVM